MLVVVVVVAVTVVVVVVTVPLEVSKGFKLNGLKVRFVSIGTTEG